MNRKEALVTAFLSSLTMATLMSGIISLSKLGFTAEWLVAWRQGFTVAWPCALLLSLTLQPQVRRLAKWLARPRTTEEKIPGPCDA